jgi:long-subunit fatty acid transport protein
MTMQQKSSRGMKLTLIASALWLGMLCGGQAIAGGLLLYEVGTADVGLASAGWAARAQDASTVLTNPAGMTRLEGSQVLLGAQALYGDYGFSIGSGTSSGLGAGDGGNPIGWFPGGSAFLSYSISPDLKLGFIWNSQVNLDTIAPRPSTHTAARWMWRSEARRRSSWAGVAIWLDLTRATA